MPQQLGQPLVSRPQPRILGGEPVAFGVYV